MYTSKSASCTVEIMDVSIIFATHNRQDVLGAVFDAWRKVDKVTKYTYEIICSDDESTDQTTKIIEQVQDLPIKLIRNKKGGASKARNAALEIATGKLIIFTGDDIFPNENYINAHYENYLKYGECVATLGRIDWHPDIKLNHLMKHITEIGCEQFGFIGLPAYQMIDFRHFYTSNISVPASLLKSLDRCFNTDFDKYGFEDIELGYRLQKAGMKIYYDPDIMAYHHHVYDSVEKFCNRQISSGEELVVFNHMHNDLEDKCICDIDNCTESFKKYKKKHPGAKSARGMFVSLSIKVAKKITRMLEKKIAKKDRALCRVVCSFVYAAVFRFSFYYGIALRIAQENNFNSNESQIVEFAYQYMQKPFHEIYWNTGRGFNENEARKWVCWDDTEILIEHKLPEGVQEVRIAPLKDFCKAEMKKMSFVLKDGREENAQIEWHNACVVEGNYYDFTHTDDTCILIKDIPSDYKAIIVEMRVTAMKKHGNAYKMIRYAVGALWNKIKYKTENAKEWDMQYAYGQRRRIQIGISGDLDEVTKQQLINEYQEQVRILGDDVVISDAANMQMGYTNYIYNPCDEPLDITQMLQVAYTLLNEVIDYVVVSKSYVEFPLIACKNLRDVFIYNANLTDVLDYSKMKVAKGRIMRLPAYSVEKNTINIKEYCEDVKLNKEYYLGTNTMEYRISERTFGKRECEKPMIFVVPIFLAVGGVERNTIEVMRQLKEHYDFCLITLERHAEQQGSLHYQLQGICKYIFDLKEITEHEHYLETLYELKEIFNPSIMWLCNNSPWFEQHTTQIRKIFKDIPIIAQDVYDTKVGWIEYYKNAEVKTFDRFIAITRLIKDTFINEYQIPEEKIDVIYSVVDDAHIKSVKKENLSYEAICEKYGLDREKEHYSYVARLTEQKNPIRYLELVKNVLRENAEQMQFIMVGDGVYKEKVDEYIQKNNLQEQLIRIPYVANTPELIGALDGLIITSDYEGLPIVCIEAMSMGTPIFSTDTGDTRRFVEENQSGRIIDESISDVDNFMKFHENLALYKENSAKHMEDILNFFSVNNVSKQYYETFSKAIADMER